MSKIPNRSKVFSLILWFGITASLFFISWPIYRIVAMNSLSFKEVKSSLYRHLLEKKTKEYPRFVDLKKYPPNPKFVFLGASSLLIPFNCDGSKSHGAFPNQFAKMTKEVTQNLSYCGVTSTQILQTFKRTIVNSDPKVIFLYSGHNDFNSALQYWLNENYFYFFRSLPLIKFFERFCDPLLLNCSGKVRWWLSSKIEYRFFRIASLLNLLNLKEHPLEELNQIIVDFYIKNIKEIISIAEKKGSKIVIMRPIYNHDFKPTLADGSIPRDFQNLSLIKKKELIDQEYFSSNIRAKNILWTNLLKLEDPNIIFFDTEKIMREKGHELGNADFSDFFHFEPEFHRSLAESLSKLSVIN